LAAVTKAAFVIREDTRSHAKKVYIFARSYDQPAQAGFVDVAERFSAAALAACQSSSSQPDRLAAEAAGYHAQSPPSWANRATKDEGLPAVLRLSSFVYSAATRQS